MKSRKTSKLVLVDLPEKQTTSGSIVVSRGRISGALVASVLIHGAVFAAAVYYSNQFSNPNDYSDSVAPHVTVTASVTAPASEAAELQIQETEKQKKPPPPPPEKRDVQVEDDPNIELPVLVARLENPRSLVFPKTVEISDPVSDPDEEHEPSLTFEKKEAPKKSESSTKKSTVSSAASRKSTTTGNTSTSTAKNESKGKTGKTSGARLVKKVAPNYPASARNRGTQGTVIILVTISTSGRVSGAVVSRSSGSSALDGAALSAVRKWKFSPALERGVAKSSRLKVPVAFKLR